jgi:hypothetical protein
MDYSHWLRCARKLIFPLASLCFRRPFSLTIETFDGPVDTSAVGGSFCTMNEHSEEQWANTLAHRRIHKQNNNAKGKKKYSLTVVYPCVCCYIYYFYVNGISPRRMSKTPVVTCETSCRAAYTRGGMKTRRMSKAALVLCESR